MDFCFHLLFLSSAWSVLDRKYIGLLIVEGPVILPTSKRHLVDGPISDDKSADPAAATAPWHQWLSHMPWLFLLSALSRLPSFSSQCSNCFDVLLSRILFTGTDKESCVQISTKRFLHYSDDEVIQLWASLSPWWPDAYNWARFVVLVESRENTYKFCMLFLQLSLLLSFRLEISSLEFTWQVCFLNNVRVMVLIY